MSAPSDRAATHLVDHSEAIASAITDLTFRRLPELEKKYGTAGRAHCHKDALFHLSFLAQATRLNAPRLFVDYVGWAKVMLAARGVPAADLLASLEIMHEATRNGVDPEGAELLAVPIHAAIKAYASLPETLELLVDGAERDSPAGVYLRAALDGDRNGPLQLVLDLVAAGTPLPDIYIDVLERAQREVGRMWQMGRITVGQEHFCTATTQLVISNLFPMLLARTPGRFKLVAACVGDEVHEVGLRIVTDLLELSGWTTRYLGANVPASSIVDAALSSSADVIALSVTLTPHLADAERIIAAIRAHPGTRSMKIVVGGAPFQLEEGLWKDIGADGWASDGREAARVIESLVM